MRDKNGRFCKGHKQWFGKERKKQTRKKISKTLVKKGIGFKKGYIPWNKGKPSPNKGKKRPEFSGKNHPNWKGGYENKLKKNMERYLAKKNVGGSHTLGDWQTLKAQYNWTCPACLKKEPNIVLTEDHIIPISRGGSDNIENIQPLCRSCNSSKYNKIIKKYENNYI